MKKSLICLIVSAILTVAGCVSVLWGSGGEVSVFAGGAGNPRSLTSLVGSLIND